MRLIALPFILFCSCIGTRYGNGGARPSEEVIAGRQFVYSYASEGAGYSDIQMLYNTDSTAKAKPFFYRPSIQVTGVKMRCQLRKTIVHFDGDSMLVCFEIMQPDLQIESNFLPVDAGAISKELTLPVFAEVSGSGKILSVKTDTAVSYLAAGIVRNILSNTQAVILAGDKESWEVSEDDINGTFNAGYRMVNRQADSIVYRKVNLGYEKIKSAKSGQRLLADNTTTITTDPSGILQHIQISESLMTLFGMDTIVASGSRTDFQLLSASTVDLQATVAYSTLEQSNSYAKASALSAPISDEDINRMAYRNTLGHDNFETLLGKLRLVPLQDKKYESELVKQFRALAWLSEPGCKMMADLLRTARPTSDTFRVMSNALGAVETPFSIDQVAIVIAERRNEEAVMMQLLPILATTPTPTSKAADIVRGLAFGKPALASRDTENAFITSTAQLTLGGMVKSLSAFNRQKADELTGIIVENMKDSRDTLQQLLVYGNTGSNRLLPVYTAYINNPLVSDEIRKEAVFAMRLIEEHEVPALLDQLSMNKDTIISKSANETIRFREQFFRDKLK